jgi:hypothetical protein
MMERKPDRTCAGPTLDAALMAGVKVELKSTAKT